MDRDAAFAAIESLGMNALMTSAGRTLDDTSTGFGPALDQAFAAYRALRGTTGDEVAPADEFGFTYLLKAVTYDLLMPTFAAMVDASVDAPLTSAKFSQAYRALQAQSDIAWKAAAAFGYGAPQVGYFKANLDFLTPGAASVTEYG